LTKKTEKSDRLTGIRLDKASAGRDRLFGRNPRDDREVRRKWRLEAEAEEGWTHTQEGVGIEEEQADVKRESLMNAVQEADA
jgi:hypothetical protein